jgi:hypothetical protein
MEEQIHEAIEAAKQQLKMGRQQLFHRRVTYTCPTSMTRSKRASVSVDYQPINGREEEGANLTLYCDTQPINDERDIKRGDVYFSFDFFFGEGPNSAMMENEVACEAYLAYMADFLATKKVMQNLVEAGVPFIQIQALLLQIGSQTFRLELHSPEQPVLLKLNEHFVALGKIWKKRESAIQALKDAFDGEITSYPPAEQDVIYWWFAYHHMGAKLIER